MIADRDNADRDIGARNGARGVRLPGLTPRRPVMSKHLKTDTPTDADLKGNPGIGQSKGLTGTDPAEIEVDSTFEGDVENETNPEGGVDPDHRGRKNA